MRTTNIRILAAGMFWATLMAAPNGSQAQSAPDPFEDYERRVDDERDKVVTPAPRLARAPSRWWAGARTEVSWTSASNDLVSGQREGNTTLFVRLTPSVTYDLTERWQLTGAVGLLTQTLARDNGGRGTETDAVFEVLAHYRIPVADRFSLIPGVGVGAYVGGSNREVEATVDGQPQTFDQGTQTYGAILSGHLVAGLALTDRIELRAGLTLTGLFGAEHISDADKTLGIRTFNTGLQLGLQYGF